MPPQIWNVSGSLFIDHKEQKEEGLLVKGALLVSVYTRPGMKGFRSRRQRVRFHLSSCWRQTVFTNNSHINLHGMLEQVSASLTGEKEIEIKAVALHWIYLYSTGWKNQLFPDMKVRKWTGMLSAVRPVWSATWYRKKKLCGILRKSFFTTVEAIMEVNQKKPNRYKQAI